ncbi:hypothetical protein GWD52_20350 [Enterobacteriaceae bacterium 4M9]|nr:hypothetical protein [Enterobacteriaceae bacterium 4M9]
MLTLDEIGQVVRNSIQLILDSAKVPLAVGPISSEDFTLLSRGYGELEWDYALTKHCNSDSCYDFCIKLVEQGVVQAIPSGAALCTFDSNENIFKIHMIESFVYDDAGHPLKGKMTAITLMSAFIFSKAVGCTRIQIIEPVRELKSYYAGFGFIEISCGYIMEASLSDIGGIFNNFA